MAYSVNIENPNKTFINTVMGYNKDIKVPSMIYGNENENRVKQDYFTLAQSFHTNLKLNDSGLLVKYDFPGIGASPDGIIECDCHEKGSLKSNAHSNTKVL